MSQRVLIVEDEPDVGGLIAFNLRAAGFVTELVETGATAVMQAFDAPPAVVVVDLGLPDIDGIEVTRQLRQHVRTRHVGVLIVTARAGADMRVLALEAGADDFLAKPFAVRELVLRVQKIAQRSRPIEQPPGEVLRSGEVTMYVERREVRVREDEVSLRPTEFRLLELLLRNPGRVFSRKRLLDKVWGLRDGNLRMVDVVISRLREALGPGAEIVETVPGSGYRQRRS